MVYVWLSSGDSGNKLATHVVVVALTSYSDREDKMYVLHFCILSFLIKEFSLFFLVMTYVDFCILLYSLVFVLNLFFS